MARTKITPEQIESPKITNVGSVARAAISANSGGSVVVTLANPEPDTNYQVIVTNQSNVAYWGSLTPMVTSKTTTQFTLNVWNNGAGASGATTWSYIVARV